MPNITCSGPGPHNPANGILGTTSSNVVADVRCSSPNCVKPIDPAVTNRTSIETKAANAVTANATYLTISATATNAQVRDQVAALTRQNNALIRLALGQFDGDS